MNDLNALEERIEAYLAECPEKGEELVRALMGFYGEGLYRIFEMLHESGGSELIDRLARDPKISNLLLLHDLHPLPLEQRVAEALESVRPHLGSHGGDVSLLAVEADSVTLRLEGTCDGCPASELTLRRLIGEALEQAAPEVASIKVEGSTPAEEGPYETCPPVTA